MLRRAMRPLRSLGRTRAPESADFQQTDRDISIERIDRLYLCEREGHDPNGDGFPRSNERGRGRPL